MRVLVTGAAGFIGGAVASGCRQAGHDVLGVDAFIEQAHADGRRESSGVRHCDVRDASRLAQLLHGVDVVCHQAAMVGAGVSPADLPLYASHNDLGTATLLAAMAATQVSRLVLASSMVVYGDGRYACPSHGQRPARPRQLAELARGVFDIACPDCSAAMTWLPVSEGASLDPRSSYAASKVAQEHYAAAWARQAAGSVIALRYHNVYGPGMPRNTPYSGVAAIFRSALERGQPPLVFEDGGQMRDFVHVSDIAAANMRAIEAVAMSPVNSFTSYNISSGTPISIAEVANLVAAGVPGPAVEAVVTGEFRSGDVRHIVASAEKARRGLGFTAAVAPADGLRRFARDPLRD